MEDSPEEGTWTVGNQDLRGHTSSNMGYCEIPHKKAQTAIHCPLGQTLYPNEKATVIANYLENLFTPHKVCDTENERRVEARVQADDYCRRKNLR
jgi:hypothetical protein